VITTEQIQELAAEATLHFHPVARDADGRPQYRFNNQLRKLAFADKTEVGELRWSRSKKGIWSVNLCRSGKIVTGVELGKKRDLRDPRMMQMIRAVYAALLTAAAEAEAEVEATEPEAAPAAA
jgi:hypothetical protein